MITKIITISLVCISLAACDWRSYDALVESSTGHDAAGETPKAETFITATPKAETVLPASSSVEPMVVAKALEPSSVQPVLTWDDPACHPIFRVNENPCGLPGSYWDTHN